MGSVARESAAIREHVAERRWCRGMMLASAFGAASAAYSALGAVTTWGSIIPAAMGIVLIWCCLCYDTEAEQAGKRVRDAIARLEAAEAGEVGRRD